MHHIGYVNEADGKDLVKKTGPLILEFTMEFTSSEAGPEAVQIMKKLDA